MVKILKTLSEGVQGINSKIIRLLCAVIIIAAACLICACTEVSQNAAAIELGSASVNTAAGDAPEETAEPELSPTPTASPTPEPTPTPYEGELIAEFARQFEGYKYVYSGEDPDIGFDCSGLVQYVYRQFGYRLSRVASDQATNGEHVDFADLLPGDIVCFKSGSGYIGHCGIYLGDGYFIHAMDSAHGVVITDLEEWLITRKLEARRIIGNVEKLTDEEMAEADRIEEEYLEQQRQEEELKKLQEEAEKKAAAESEEESETPQATAAPVQDPNAVVIVDDPSQKYKDDPLPDIPDESDEPAEEPAPSYTPIENQPAEDTSQTAGTVDTPTDDVQPGEA